MHKARCGVRRNRTADIATRFYPREATVPQLFTFCVGLWDVCTSFSQNLERFVWMHMRPHFVMSLLNPCARFFRKRTPSAFPCCCHLEVGTYNLVTSILNDFWGCACVCCVLQFVFPLPFHTRARGVRVASNYSVHVVFSGACLSCRFRSCFLHAMPWHHRAFLCNAAAAARQHRQWLGSAAEVARWRPLQVAILCVFAVSASDGNCDAEAAAGTSSPLNCAGRARSGEIGSAVSLWSTPSRNRVGCTWVKQTCSSTSCCSQFAARSHSKSPSGIDNDAKKSITKFPSASTFTKAGLQIVLLFVSASRLAVVKWSSRSSPSSRSAPLCWQSLAPSSARVRRRCAEMCVSLGLFLVSRRPCVRTMWRYRPFRQGQHAHGSYATNKIRWRGFCCMPNPLNYLSNTTPQRSVSFRPSTAQTFSLLRATRTQVPIKCDWVTPCKWQANLVYNPCCLPQPRTWHTFSLPTTSHT